MRKWTALAAVAALGFGVSVASAGSVSVTNVNKVIKEDPRGDKPVKWTKAAANDQVELVVGQIKEMKYHSHGNETHLMVVVKGRATAMFDSEMREVGPGDILTLPAGVPHSLEQKGSEPLVVVMTRTAGIDLAADTKQHEMHHSHQGHHGHAVKPASTTK
jgi:mannose-6-phosphate isomerase-like protein (cupin superfamily)